MWGKVGSLRKGGPVAASCEDGLVYVFDLGTDRLTELHKFTENKFTSWCTLVDTQRNLLFSGADEGYFKIHDLTTFEHITTQQQ